MTGTELTPRVVTGTVLQPVHLIRVIPCERAGCTQRLVRRGAEFFVISSIPDEYCPGETETLVFPADEYAHITCWHEVLGASGRNWSYEQACGALAMLPADEIDGCPAEAACAELCAEEG